MKKFEAIKTVGKFKKGSEIVEIVKFKKVGTKRIFFTPLYKGQRLTRTQFSRMYDAENLARLFLNRF